MREYERCERDIHIYERTLLGTNTLAPELYYWVSRNEYKLFYPVEKIKWRRPLFRGAMVTTQAILFTLMNKL